MKNDGRIHMSRRLMTVASLVTAGNRLVDAGCDHAWLCIWLVKNGYCPSAIASDVREGPLAAAREHVTAFGLDDRIEVRLSDGLRAFRPGEGDSLVLAGMGGRLMKKILSENAPVRESFRELILEPQSETASVRRFLGDLGWEIRQERMVLEDGKYYPVLRAVRSGESGSGIPDDPDRPFTQEEAFGGLLLDSGDPVLESCLKREKRILEEILAALAKSGSARALARRRETEMKLEQVKEALCRLEKAGKESL